MDGGLWKGFYLFNRHLPSAFICLLLREASVLLSGTCSFSLFLSPRSVEVLLGKRVNVCVCVGGCGVVCFYDDQDTIFGRSC